ncbi:hypothetical protein MIR68_001376 [Amoeboaphelidium protococcarum]|nr:hypothetical protein MIR68_001376 [Amoeboaphelidium protococcarum]
MPKQKQQQGKSKKIPKQLKVTEKVIEREKARIKELAKTTIIRTVTPPASKLVETVHRVIKRKYPNASQNTAKRMANLISVPKSKYTDRKFVAQTINERKVATGFNFDD